MLRSVFSVLRGDGRFVMRNLCPQEQRDWLYYDYFPEALQIDLADFWPAETVTATMEAIGFAGIEVELDHLRFDQDMRTWLAMVRRRDTNSQLMAISDSSYEAGILRLESELANADTPKERADHICLITVRGERRANRGQEAGACDRAD